MMYTRIRPVLQHAVREYLDSRGQIVEIATALFLFLLVLMLAGHRVVVQ